MKLKLLLEEKTAESIYHSDYEDLDALIKADKTGKWIYRAGKFWENFDYDKGLNALIKIIKKKERRGIWIYYAGKNWKKFNYEKGLNVLREVNRRCYEFALKDWPKGIAISQEISKNIKDKAKKMTGKKLKL